MTVALELVGSAAVGRAADGLRVRGRARAEDCAAARRAEVLQLRRASVSFTGKLATESAAVVGGVDR